MENPTNKWGGGVFFVYFGPFGAFGQEIIAQGDLAADYFYICQSGTFEIFVAAPWLANLSWRCFCGCGTNMESF